MGDVIRLPPRRRPAPREPLTPAAWDMAAAFGFARPADLAAALGLPALSTLGSTITPARRDA